MGILYLMTKRSKSSQRWLEEHERDPYVKRALHEGYRSRAAFKLLELQEKDHFLKPGMKVVDLGAAPGSWCEVARKFIGKKGQIVAMDLLPMDPIEDVTFIQGDFTEEEIYQRVLTEVGGGPIDVVMSDMSPNISGMSAIDQPRSMYLVELALDFAQQVLKPEGVFLAKVFQGEGFDAFLADIKHQFKRVVCRKPKASRPRSKEVYLLATGFRGQTPSFILH